MPREQPEPPTPPQGLRPAQLGIILDGRVITRHISATLTDLARRGFMSIEAIPDDEDWLLADLRSGAIGLGTLLPFEAILLDGLFARRPEVRLSRVAEDVVLREDLILVLNRVRGRLRRDAIRHGRLRLWHWSHRTRRGEFLLKQVHGFREELRVLPSSDATESDATETVARLAPYAMIFGLDVPGGLGFPPSWFKRFETVWQGNAPGGANPDLRDGTTQRASAVPAKDFAHSWPSIRGGYGSGGHGSGHGGDHLGGGMDGGHGGGGH
jgi:Predicted membrane protein (DUF2207)